MRGTWFPVALAVAALLPTVLAIDYTCAPGVNPSPGVSLPRGDVYLLLDSGPQKLFCLLNPKHDLYVNRGFNASHLRFSTPDGFIPSTVINETAIVAEFLPNAVGIFPVNCVAVSNDIPASPPKGICNQKVLVGNLPQPVENFTCISRNWHSLNCTWSEPANPVPTAYHINYHEVGSSRYLYRTCPNAGDLEHHLGRPVSNQTCYLDGYTSPPYRVTVKEYVFFFNATNALKTDGIVQHITVDHYSIMKPNPPINVRVDRLSADQLKLSYSIPRELHTFEPGFDHSVRYRNEWWNEWIEVDTAGWDRQAVNQSVELDNLPFPYTNYTFEIKMISSKANKTDLRLWSDPVQASQLTDATVPAEPPSVNRGSFEILNRVGGSRTVLVYWQALKNSSYNGPDFGYHLSTDVPGLAPDHVFGSHARYIDTLADGFTVKVLAKNEVGESPKASLVRVPAARELNNLSPRSVTKVFREAWLYDVSWLPPANSSHVTSYTLFWCLPKEQLDRPHQCDGYLDWKTISVNSSAQQNATYTHQLILPSTSLYQVAVSANTVTSSSGMTWASCIIIQGRLVSQVSQIELLHPTSNSFFVKWKLDCHDRSDIVYGYLVEYYCGETLCGSVKASPSQDTVHVRDLLPYTNYSVGIKIGSRDGFGQLGPLVQIQTLPAPPSSPPSQITVDGDAVGASTARIAWQPPDKPNGVIYQYYVTKHYIDCKGTELFVESLYVNDTAVDFDNLLSYTRYVIKISGCTKLQGNDQRDGCSTHFGQARFKTEVGPSGKPNPPQIEFLTSTDVNVTWDSCFQVGAESVDIWQIAVRKSGRQWDSLQPFILNISGSQAAMNDSPDVPLFANLSLKTISNVQGWSPDCENDTNANQYMFSVRAVVIDSVTLVEYPGAWSKQVQALAPCKSFVSWTLIIIVCVFVTLVVIISSAGICRANNWWFGKRDFFDKLGREVDAKIMLSQLETLETDVLGPDPNRSDTGDESDIEGTSFHGPDSSAGGQVRDDPGDTDNLLQSPTHGGAGGNLRHHSNFVSTQSDRTSGCGSHEGAMSSSGSTRSCGGRGSDQDTAGSGYVSLDRTENKQSNSPDPNKLPTNILNSRALRSPFQESNYQQASLPLHQPTQLVTVPANLPLMAANTASRFLSPSAPRHQMSAPASSQPPRSDLIQTGAREISHPTHSHLALPTSVPSTPSSGSSYVPLSTLQAHVHPGYSRIAGTGGSQPLPASTVSATPPHVLQAQAADSGYITISQAKELLLLPETRAQQYCRVIPNVDIVQQGETVSSANQQPPYLSPSFV